MRLVLIGAVLPATYVIVNTRLVGYVSPAPLLAALVTEVGLLGLLCGRFVRPLWLMWLIYGWVWLVMEMLVVPLAMYEIWKWETDSLPAALLGGQLGLVIVWAILGSSRWTIRWPVALLLAAAIFAPIASHKTPPTELLILMVVQSAILAAVCVLLAVLRFRLAIAKPADNGAVSQTVPPDAALLSTNQFRLRDVLFWTTALAIALAIARAAGYWGASLEVWQQIRAGLIKSGALAVFLPTPTHAAFVAFINLIALWAALGAGPARVRCLVFVICALAAAMANGLIDYYRNAPSWRSLPSPWYLDWDLIWLFETSTMQSLLLVGGMLFAALLIFRGLGYRLCQSTVGQSCQE